MSCKTCFYRLSSFFLFFIHGSGSMAIASESNISAATYDPTMFMASLKVIWGLLVVLGIIFAIYALVKRRFNFLPNSNANTRIKIVEAKHLMPKKSLYLIEVRGKEYLIGVTDQNISLLSSHIKTDSFKDVLDHTVEG